MELMKRLRMTLHFEVTVEDLTDERLREYYRPFRNYDEIVGDLKFWANLSRQIRLQGALLEDEEALARFLTYIVTTEVDSRVDSRLGEVFRMGGEQIEEEIFEPLFSRLDEDDARYFREVSAAGALWENIEVLSHSFIVKWTVATLEEVRTVVQGSSDEFARNLDYP